MASGYSSSNMAPDTSRRKPQEITRENIGQFMEQFDTIISDCDGVLWMPLPIPNTREALAKLREAGKKVLFVTNNALVEPDFKFKTFGYPLGKDEVTYPPHAIQKYLQKIGFNKKVFVIGSTHYRDYLQKHGMEIVPATRTGGLVEENLKVMLGELDEDLEIGAVIIEADINVNYMDITKAVNHLRRPDCLFLAGATDTLLPTFDNGKVLIGPGYFIRAIEDMSGRKAHVFGKPGPAMVTDYLKEIHGVDLQRAVFVGDSLDSDMGIANACGMKKLLVLTGLTQFKDLDTCKPELIPDFYIKSFGDFAELLTQK